MLRVLEPLKRKRFLVGLVVATTIGTAFCLASYFNLLYSMQLQSSDLLFKGANINQSKESEGKIVIVGIDDKSLEQLGRFSSWPRSYHAQLIDTLAEAEARVVVFDVLFSEAAPGDEEMAASITNAGNVVLPIIDTSTTNDPIVTEEVAQSGRFLRPLEVFEQGAIALGHANVLPDKDGVVRSLLIAIHNGDDYEPALALATVAKYLRRPGVIESPIEDNILPFAGRLIPIDDNNSMLINYTGTSEWGSAITNFQTVSFIDTLRGEISPDVFQDKIVVIGATASGLSDTSWTPMGRMMNGAEIHASAINTILTGNFIKPASFAVTIASIMILALLCGVAVLRLRVLWAMLSAIFLGIVYFLIAFALFDKGFMLNMLYPPLAIIGVFVGVSVYNLAFERTEKNRITKTFGRYISSSIVDKILAASEEGELKLGGEQREVTTVFADVRGFTTITESMPPEDLVKVLNTYLSVVIKAVLKRDGMINKFGGDSIMAIWNVPTVREEHALLATMAAVDAQRAISELQKIEIALPKMYFGIGINTGKAVAGNMGSEDRLEYSVIGDAVNVAARLTSVVPGGKVWIGVNTFELVKDYIVAKPLKPLVVKGKREPIIAYEVLEVRPESADGQDKNAVTAGSEKNLKKV